MKTNREAHEEAAGMSLAPEFFTKNGIDPDAHVDGMIPATAEVVEDAELEMARKQITALKVEREVAREAAAEFSRANDELAGVVEEKDAELRANKHIIDHLRLEVERLREENSRLNDECDGLARDYDTERDARLKAESALRQLKEKWEARISELESRPNRTNYEEDVAFGIQDCVEDINMILSQS